jgi:hypothetical protein
MPKNPANITIHLMNRLQDDDDDNNETKKEQSLR